MIFVDKDTLVDVCALGVVNGDPLVVTGFSTQFNGVFEVKPRFPADARRVYQVTFVYNDLEDVVAVGEDVQLRGDFTSWATNPITLSARCGLYRVQHHPHPADGRRPELQVLRARRRRQRLRLAQHQQSFHRPAGRRHGAE